MRAHIAIIERLVSQSVSALEIEKAARQKLERELADARDELADARADRWRLIERLRVAEGLGLEVCESYAGLLPRNDRGQHEWVAMATAVLSGEND